MSTVIAGAGISGLTCAIYLKRSRPHKDVVVVSETGTSNSKLAGQRYRTRLDGLSDLAQMCAAQRFDGLDRTRLEQFFSTGRDVLRDFTQARDGVGEPLTFRDRQEWFGPQLGEIAASGKGIGTSVLAWLRMQAMRLGVQFRHGELRGIEIDAQGRAQSATLVSEKHGNFLLAADHWVIATGGPSGSLFHSTNADNGATLLVELIEAGFPVRDADIFMLHMAGICDESGRPKKGCHETDLLRNHQVFLQDERGGFSIPAPRITALLAQNRAHYHFAEVCREIIAHGGVAKYVHGDDVRYGRVMHHYSHLGMRTDDGVSVSGAKNILAVGDASGIGHWIGSRERLPGMALLHCLVTGHLAGRLLADAGSSGGQVELMPAREAGGSRPGGELEALRNINTRGLYGFFAKDDAACKRWKAELDPSAPTWSSGVHRLVPVSRLVSQRCNESLANA